MKHLIVVHSHLSYLVINQYFLDRNIDPDDCLFIVNARYRHLPEGNHYTNFIFFPDELLPDGFKRVFHKNNIITGIKNIKYIENRINEFFHGDLFLMYLTTTSLDYLSALVTMKQCKGYYLMEEGSASYYRKTEIPKLYKGAAYGFAFILSKILPRFFALKCSSFSYDNKYFLGTISTAENAFPDFPGVHIVINTPFTGIELDSVPDVILSIDSSLMISLGDFFPKELYEKIAVFFKNKGYKGIAYKFHPKYFVFPELLAAYREGLTSVFGENIVELPESSQLENYFLSYPIDFCSDFSSVGIYASNFGRKCYSYRDLVMETYPDSTYDKDFNIPKIVFGFYTKINASEIQ